MEETIGYEALFSSDEWDSIDLVPDEDLEVLFAAITPDGDTVEATHSCTVYDPPGEQVGNEAKFEIECERCGLVGASDDRTEAEAIQRLHEAFVATLVEKWTVTV